MRETPSAEDVVADGVRVRREPRRQGRARTVADHAGAVGKLRGPTKKGGGALQIGGGGAAAAAGGGEAGGETSGGKSGRPTPSHGDINPAGDPGPSGKN